MSNTSFSSRAKRGLACDYISLNEAESDIYTGAGLRLAQVVQGQIVAMHNPRDVTHQDDTEAMANDALEMALAWMQEHQDGELWLGECSCYTFCEPHKIERSNAQHIAHLARRIGDALSKY